MLPLNSIHLDIDRFLSIVHAKKQVLNFRKNQMIFSQGEGSSAVFYIERGHVKLIVVSRQGKEAILGVLDGGALFGESCIAADRQFHSAVAVTDVRVVKLDRDPIIRLMHSAGGDFYAFIALLLGRTFRIQQDFANALLESNEQRLARALLAVARLNSKNNSPFLKIGQQDWADMIGITRQRTNVILRRFRKLGFIDDSAGFRVNDSIVSILPEGLGREPRIPD